MCTGLYFYLKLPFSNDVVDVSLEIERSISGDQFKLGTLWLLLGSFTREPESPSQQSEEESGTLLLASVQTPQ